MIDAVIDFFVHGPGRPLLPVFQGSFNMAYPPNADFPADVATTIGAV